mgnify:CR=1 FL=1
MQKLISILVAAIFAAVTLNAVAAEGKKREPTKKGEPTKKRLVAKKKA